MIVNMSLPYWRPRKMYKKGLDRIKQGILLFHLIFPECFLLLFFYMRRIPSCLSNFIFLWICFNRENNMLMCENDHLANSSRPLHRKHIRTIIGNFLCCSIFVLFFWFFLDTWFAFLVYQTLCLTFTFDDYVGDF